jgi:hypothetical protein
MAGINLDQELLGAGASAKNDWASASAATALNFTGQAQFKRGFNVTIGLEALATADAGLAKFIAATVRGNAFAEAQASLQLQLPLNLFKEFGLSLGAQAKAQAAAGIEVGLGLKIGDFIQLVRGNPETLGLPLELILLLLEEVDVSGIVEVHVAASAMAYASITITGNVIDQPGKPAGFYYTVDAGLGLAAGVGFSARAGAGFHDFRHFYGRAVDRVVDVTLGDIVALLPPDAAKAGSTAAGILDALTPIAKMAFRLAYEVGQYIAVNKPGVTDADALTMANHCVGIVLEEAQRFLFHRFLQTGLAGIGDFVTRESAALAAGVWDGLRPKREALATALYAMPAEPFEPSQPNIDYWRNLIAKGLSLVEALPGTAGATLTRGFALAFAASELLLEAVRSRINQPQAYVVVVGLGRIAAEPPFGGPLPKQPDARIKGHINSTIGRTNLAANLDYADLIQFLASGVILDSLRAAFPQIAQYIAIFQGPLAAAENDVLRTFLTNRQAFMADGNGNINPQRTLQALLEAVDGFVTQQINAQILQVIDQRISDPNVRLYFSEVLLGALNFTKDVAFRAVLDWKTTGLDKDAFTEALASVMTMMLGRSLVVTGDIFMARVLEQMQTGCTHAANRLDRRPSPFQRIGIQASPELQELFTTTLRIGGEVFAPLPEATRTRIRHILYEIMEPLPPGASQSFATQLQDQFFIPNQDHLDELRDELLDISRRRFGLFVEKVLGAAGDLVAGLIQDFIHDAIDTILQWERDLEQGLAQLAQQIAQLAQEVARRIAEVEAAFRDAADALDQLLETLADPSLRSQLRGKIAREITSRARSALRGNDLYKDLPLKELKDFAEDLLSDAVRDLVGSPLLDPVFDAIGGVAGALDDVLDDVRGLDPTHPLGPQILDLLLDRVEDAVRDHFGSGKPHVNVTFSFSYDFFGRHTVSFHLGRIDIPLGTFLGLIRDAVDALDFYESALDQAATALRDAFEKQFALEGKQGDLAAARRHRADLDRISQEHSGAPKTIAILSPAPAAVLQADLEARIHLGGVPASYLGLGKDEQQRVFIFLNGEQIAPKSLVLGRNSTPATSAEHAEDIDLARLPGFDAATGVFQGAGATISLPAAGALATGASAAPGPKAPAFSAPGGLALSRRAAKPKAGGQGAPIGTSFTLTNFRPGRTLTPSQIQGVRAGLGDGTDITFSVPLEELDQGANTLTVVVLDRGGRPYQQVVSFGVVAPPKPKPGSPGGIFLPRPPGKTGAIRPPAKPAVGLGVSRVQLHAALKRSTKYVADQSKRNLTDFRR